MSQKPLSKNEEGRLNSIIKKCKEPKSSVTIIKKLLSLLKHNVTSNHTDRQLALFNDFIEVSKDGYWLKDLEYIIELFDIIVTKNNAEFDEALLKMIELVKIAPRMTSPHDILDYFNDLVEYFNTLARILFSYEKEQYVITLIDCLKVTFSPEQYKSDKVSVDRCKEAAGESFLPEVITELILILNEDAYDHLLKLSMVFCSLSIDIKMLKQGAFGNYIMRLDPLFRRDLDNKREDPTVDSVIIQYDTVSAFLWFFIYLIRDQPESFLKELPPLNFRTLCSLRFLHFIILCETIDFIKKSENGETVVSTTMMMYLNPMINTERYTFQVFVLQEWMKIDRNNMLALLINIFRYFDCSDFFKAGLGDDLTQLMLAGEIPTTLSWLPFIKFKKCSVDYVFKTMLLLFVPQYIQMNLKILEKNRIIKGLLILISEQDNLGFMELHNDTVVITTLKILKTLIPMCPEEFIKHGGPDVLSSHIKSYKSYELDSAKFISAIQLLNSIIRMPHSNYVKIFRQTGIKITLIGILKKLVKKTPTPEIQKSLTYLFCCLEVIYTEKCFPDNSLVDLVQQFLKPISQLEKLEYTIGDGYIQCTLDFLWKWICSCLENLINFVKKGGIYLLLDILTKSTYDTVVIVLGILCDLAQHELSVPYFVTWRCGSQTFFMLLIKIFRVTLNKMKVALSPEGVIEDVVNPLIGEIQKKMLNEKLIDSSPAIVSSVGSRKLKVFGLIHLLTVKHKEVYEIANEKYKICNNELNTEDKIIMVLIDNYLTLKMAQVWQELQLELDQQNITPVSFDLQMISFMNQRASEWGQYIKNAQLRILRDQEQENDKREREFYRKLRDAQTQADLNTIVDIEYTARCTNRMFRLRRKIIQNNEKERAMLDKENSPFHKTIDENLNITPIYNQNINVISMKDEKVDIAEPDITPVSSISEIASFNERFEHSELESDMDNSSDE